MNENCIEIHELTNYIHCVWVKLFIRFNDLPGGIFLKILYCFCSRQFAHSGSIEAC